MTDLITPEQQAYLNGLRTGDVQASLISIQPTLTSNSRKDFDNFEQFLKNHGHSTPQPADLYLPVSREAFLDILHYADDRNCLILQCCFGFDIPPVIDYVEVLPVPPNRPVRVMRVGRVLLINKGNFHQTDSRRDDDFFDKDTVFRNEDGNTELFLNMDRAQPREEDVAGQRIANFRAIYPPEHGPYIFGYLLPVKALISIFSDPNHPLGSANMLTFRWGLTSGNLGNFTLVIGTDNLFFDPTIEFRKDVLTMTGKDPSNDCPPSKGC